MSLDFQLGPEDIQLFLEECDELLQELEQDLLELERDGGDGDVLDRVFRVAHTLKGSAATLGHKEMADFTHHMEDLLSKLRTGEIGMNREIGDTLLASLDVLREYRDEVDTGQSRNIDATDLLDAFVRLSGASVASETKAAADQAAAVLMPEAPPKDPTTPTKTFPLDVRMEDIALVGEGQTVWQVSIALDFAGLMPAVRAFQVLLAAESWGDVIRSDPSRQAIEEERVGEGLHLLIAGSDNADALRQALAAIPDISVTTIAPAQAAAPEPAPTVPTATNAQQANAPARTPARTSGGRTVRVAVELLDNLMNLVGELVIDRTRLTRLVGDLGTNAGDVASALGQTSNHIGRVTTDLQEEIMRARMLPVENLFRKFPRMVRDLALAQGKEVELIVRGEDTELDRSIMEEIADPLLHLLRNAIDHAIEPTAERIAAGKDAKGKVWLEAAHEEGSIVITVRDDGRGMDRQRIAAKALERGIITDDQLRRLDDQATLELIMQPGFSLAEKVTDVSGRGVGMDVVRSNIERINGTVSLASTMGEGSEIRIRLPLTLAIIQALLVRVGGETYALPLSAVVEAATVDRTTVRNVQNQELISLRGDVIPLVHVRRTFGLPDANAAEELPVVIVQAGNRQVGFVVDGLEGEQEIVVKNLGPLGKMVPGLAGATILGDGSVALILDTAAMLPSSRTKEDLNNGYHLAG